MQNKYIETKLKDAMEHLTPDVLDSILLKCGEPRRNIYIVQPQKQKRRWVHAMGTLAAAFAMVLGGLFTVNRISNSRIDALIMLDVNPSIELTVNRNDRIIDVETRNEDAVTVLDNMDLKNIPVDVAINALVGSMLKHGYIQENANSILLSVESANEEKSAALQRELTQSISQQLNMVNGAVISQNLTSDDELQALAAEHQISYGKAALVQKILNENSHLLFADLAQLSVNQLNLLIISKRIEADGMEAQGQASDTAYIGEEKAKQTALEHAGTNESEIKRLHIELDYDDGLMVYDVEFYYNDREYEYEINASDGSIIGHDQESRDSYDRSEQERDKRSSQNSADFIGEERAAEIAENHSGGSSYTGLKVELDKDNGLYIYEVEFKADGKEYDYEINATAGEIISWDVED